MTSSSEWQGQELRAASLHAALPAATEVSLAAIAEDPQAYRRPGPGAECLAAPHAVLFRSGSSFPDANGPSRLRFSDAEVEARVAEIRDWFAKRDRREFVWNVGPHSTPRDLERRLLELGMIPNPTQAHGTSMVLDHEPPVVQGRWEIRPEASLEDVIARWELVIEVFGWTEEEASATRADVEASWERVRAWPREWGYGAWLDGNLAAAANVIDLDAPALLLAGAATREWARGRGIYRALVRRRWEDAVALGKPALVIQASDAARAVLEPLGFRAYGRVAYLRDSVR